MEKHKTLTEIAKPLDYEEQVKKKVRSLEASINNRKGQITKIKDNFLKGLEDGILQNGTTLMKTICGGYRLPYPPPCCPPNAISYEWRFILQKVIGTHSVYGEIKDKDHDPFRHSPYSYLSKLTHCNKVRVIYHRSYSPFIDDVTANSYERYTILTEEEREKIREWKKKGFLIEFDLKKSAHLYRLSQDGKEFRDERKLGDKLFWLLTMIDKLAPYKISFERVSPRKYKIKGGSPTKYVLLVEDMIKSGLLKAEAGKRRNEDELLLKSTDLGKRCLNEYADLTFKELLRLRWF